MVRKLNFFTFNFTCDWAAAVADAAKRNGTKRDAARSATRITWSPDRSGGAVAAREAKQANGDSSLANPGHHGNGNNEDEEGEEDIEQAFFDAIAIGQQGHMPDARSAERMLLSFLVEKRRQVGVGPLRCRMKGRAGREGGHAQKALLNLSARSSPCFDKLY